jgi:hypothetical protein
MGTQVMGIEFYGHVGIPQGILYSAIPHGSMVPGSYGNSVEPRP